MTALSRVKTVLSIEFGETGKTIEQRLAARGYCIARIDWCEQAAAIMDEWQAAQDERPNPSNAGRRAIAPRPTGAGDRRLPASVRVRRDGDGDSAAVGEVVTDLRVGTDGGAP